MKRWARLTVLGLALVGGPVTTVALAAEPAGSPASEDLTTITDPARVFERAFWRRVAETDQILHAERRETHAGTELTGWEWFIVVDPSPELLHYLFEKNAFKVRETEEAPEILNAPTWFTYKDAGGKAYQSASNNLILIYDRSKNRLYAANRGLGFAAGTPEPVTEQSSPSNVPRRLPAQSPPDPR